MKRILALILSFIMTVTAMSAFAAYYPVSKSVSFADVKTSHWGYLYIEECVEQGIMKGTDYNTFSPDASMSVAEIVTIAVRLAGISASVSGENWYDGAVNAALAAGIIKEGQFDSYTRPATRAEVAGLLGITKPESFYQGINNIYSIYDVNEMTPYCGEIFKLYRAGILTGSGDNAAFNPYNNISRAEAATLIARLLNEKLRRNFTIAGGVSDYTVRSTDKRVNIGGVYGYGVVEIGGKYFILPEMFTVTHGYKGGILEFEKRGDTYNLDLNSGYTDSTAYAIDYSFAMPSGVVMGTAEPSSDSFMYDGTLCYGAVYTIDGKFLMISLEAMGAVAEGNDFVIPVESYPAVINKEIDMVGNALGSLQRQNQKDTVRAIHDYIVNTITYDPTVSAPYNMSQSQIDEAGRVLENAQNTYHFDNNITLASKYGVCHYYALLFNEMCLRSGIPCFYVEGSTSGSYGLIGHAWNMVYTDGEWLYVDTTWDDPVSSKPELRHSYYMVDANALARDHLWDEFPMPDEYDPAWEQLDPNNITSADMYRKCLVAQVMMGKDKISLRTTKSGAYGGSMCLYFYPLMFWSVRYGYNDSTGTYDYEFN